MVSLIFEVLKNAAVAELVDALDLKSNWYLNASAGSSPARGTNPYLVLQVGVFYWFTAEAQRV